MMHFLCVERRVRELSIVFYPSKATRSARCGVVFHTKEQVTIELYSISGARTLQWVERIEALPGYEKTFPAHWRST